MWVNGGHSNEVGLLRRNDALGLKEGGTRGVRQMQNLIDDTHASIGVRGHEHAGGRDKSRARAHTGC
eukprot:4230234-Lingulodinium_polyedra.AAC.1